MATWCGPQRIPHFSVVSLLSTSWGGQRPPPQPGPDSDSTPTNDKQWGCALGLWAGATGGHWGALPWSRKSNKVTTASGFWATLQGTGGPTAVTGIWCQAGLAGARPTAKGSTSPRLSRESGNTWKRRPGKTPVALLGATAPDNGCAFPAPCRTASACTGRQGSQRSRELPRNRIGNR